MPASQFELRREAVAQGLEARRLDGLLVFFGPNLRYLSGFTGSNGALLATPGRSLLFTDPRYAIQAASESTCKLKISRGPMLPDVVAAIARLRLKRIGFESAHTTCDAFEFLRSRLPVNASLEPAGGWIERMRALKSPEEIARIRCAVELNSAAFEQAVARIRPGMKESDLAAELEYRMRRLGAEKPAFETIVAAGARSALPHAQPGATPLSGLVVVDMGVQLGGYASDMTRMLHLGRPGTRVRRAYKAVLEAQLAAIDAIRAGVPAGRADAAARRVLAGYGLERAFVHATGHGLGLEIHEPPRIGRREKTLLEAGMAITVEPGVYIEGFGGIRIEDTVVVTGRGCEILTPTPKELRVI